MSFALSAGVTGLQAHQKMLDVAGNNLANVNTTAFKASRITFSELLSETLKKASQPTTTVGGTNPQQMGSGVGISGIAPNMTQGNIVSTGNPLDMALEGEGYFVLSDGSQNLYTRAGTFSVDANSNLVDASTGYIVQRIGSVGESDNFQVSGNSNINVPYNVAMAAQSTSTITLAGNLSSNSALSTPQTNILRSNIEFTTNSGTEATETTKLSELDQFSGALTAGVLTFSGLKHDGTALGSSPTVDLTMAVDSTTTLGDVLNWLNTSEGTAAVSEVQTVTLGTAPNNVPDGGTFTLTYGGETTAAIDWDATAGEIQTALEALSTVSAGDITVSGSMASGVTFTFDDTLGDAGLLTMDSSALLDGASVITNSIAETVKGFETQGILGDSATVTLSGGRLVIRDTDSGYSQTEFEMSYAGYGTMTLPAYFEISTVGGEEVKTVNISVYDSLGGQHVLSGAFVRTDSTNTWDFVVTSVTGDISDIDTSGLNSRRIKGITFDENDGSYRGLDTTTNDTAQISVTFAHDTANPQVISINLGTAGQFDGLTQFSGNSTAVAREQDGYAAGSLSTVSVNNEGVLIGAFSNGIKKEIATLQIALFQNTAGLESVGSGYFIPSANSGEAVATQAMSGGAGTVHGSSLEKSNADVATEFVNMIQAQNGFQANARTIRVANEILRELTSLIS
ncbi:MAG: flagellar hook-basal body complex protein [Planctomycetaceae bacterium]|nr:flagellar hook-basal body complex protein [Planctomycetaceae bacterium]